MRQIFPSQVATDPVARPASTLVVGFVRPEIPTLVPEPPSGEGWIHEIKHDGYRTLILIDQGNVRALSRHGRDWTGPYRRVVEAAGKLPCHAAILDGEIVVFDEKGKPVDYCFLETNPTFEKQTGLKDVTGKTIRQLAPGHEEHWFEIYGKIASTGEPLRFTERAAALNRWYDVYAFRAGSKEENKVAVLFTDITERRKAEEDRKTTNGHE